MTIHAWLVGKSLFGERDSVIKFDDDEFCVSTNSGLSGFSL